VTPSGRRILIFTLPLLGLLGYAGYSVSKQSFRDDLTAGRAAIQIGNWSSAEAHADRLERRGQTDAARLLRGLLWVSKARKLDAGPEQTKYLRAALTHFGRIRAADRVPEATILGAECLIRLEELALAESVLRTVIEEHSEIADAHRWLAAVYMDLNAPAAAAHHLSEWGRLDPSSGWPFRWAGYFYKTIDRSAAAVEAYRAALSRPLSDPVRADAARELAEVLLDSLEDYPGVLAALDQAPVNARNLPEFQVLRAAALWGLGRHDEASDLADLAIQAAPNSPAALQLRAQFYLHRDDAKSARPLLERAAALAPHDLGILKKLVEACISAGDPTSAAAHQKTFEHISSLRERMTHLYAEAERRPWDSAPRREAAALCLELQRPAEARMWAKAAVSCDPLDTAARELLASVDASWDRPVEAIRRSFIQEVRP
jgi:tetratricopeptide (TPR) repeat protein